MRLHPYPSRSERWRKVLKHVFATEERWWDIFGDLVSWRQDWERLRTAGCLQEGGHLVAQERPETHELLNRNHGAWLAAAEVAVEEGTKSRRYLRDMDGRSTYVGDRGVQVVVSARNALVTCFRPGGGSLRLSDAARADRAIFRAAVRRQCRLASLSAEAGRGPRGSGHA